MLHRPILLVLCLTLPAVGQESKPATASKPTTALRVRFSHPHVALALRTLAPDGMDEAMAMTAGQFAWFTLDGKLEPSRVVIAEGNAPALEATLDPAALLAAAPPQDLANWRRRFEGVVKLALGAAGVDNKDAAKVATALWDFPKQIAQVHIEVHVDREAPAPGEAVLRFTPAAGTPFAAALKSLQPLPGGAPVLDRGEAFCTARSAVAMAPLDPFTQALARWSAALIVKDEESRAKMVEFSTRTMALLTGDVGMVWGKNGVTMLYSTRDPKALAEFAQSDLFGANFRYMEETNLVESVQYEPKAFVHRGVTVARGEQTMKKNAAMANNPMLPADGVMRQHLAVVKEWMISAATEDDAKRLIDAALDGKIKRAPLTEGNFGEFELDTSALAAQMPGPLPFEQIGFTVGMENQVLRFKFTWK